MSKVNLGGKDYILGRAGRVNRTIEWKEGAVCYADGAQWFPSHYGSGVYCRQGALCIQETIANVLAFADFQLNEPRIGDYIPKSELDTEQKYNDAVDALELLCIHNGKRHNYHAFKLSELIKVCESSVSLDATLTAFCRRKITYSQLMAIGKLKRLMIERGKVNDSKKPNSSNLKDGNKYHRTIIGIDGTKTIVDVYRVLDAFNTGCAATDHAIKKMLCAGLRGHKDKLTDYDNAIESLQAAKELLVQKDSNANTN